MSTPRHAAMRASRLTQCGLHIAAASLLSTLAATAYAQTYTYDFTFGTGTLAGPNGLAVDAATQDILVTDGMNDGVFIFDPAGNLLHAFGGAGAGNGQFAFPTGIRMDSSSRHIIVADYGNGRVEVFAQDGTYLSEFGQGHVTSPCDLAIDPVTHTIAVSDATGSRVAIFDASGQFLSQFGAHGTGPGQFSYACGIAIDAATSHIVVDDELNHNVQIFSQTGAYLGQFGSAGQGNGQFSRPGGVTIDPVAHNFLVSDYDNSRIEVFDRAGGYLTQFANAGEGAVSGPDGLDVDPLSGTVFIADRGHAAVQAFSATAGSACGTTFVGLDLEPVQARLSQPVLFSASVAIGSPFGGTVSFSVDGGAPACSATVEDVTTTCTHPLELGTHTIVAQYSGDGFHPPGCSTPETVTIVPDSDPLPTGLGCISLPDPAIQGQPVQVVCTIQPPGIAPQHADGGAISGYVTYMQGSTVLADIPISFGTSTYSNVLGGGSYPITATYSGDADDGSSSADLTVIVQAPADDIFYGGFDVPPG